MLLRLLLMIVLFLAMSDVEIVLIAVIALFFEYIAV